MFPLNQNKYISYFCIVSGFSSLGTSYWELMAASNETSISLILLGVKIIIVAKNLHKIVQVL